MKNSRLHVFEIVNIILLLEKQCFFFFIIVESLYRSRTYIICCWYLIFEIGNTVIYPNVKFSSSTLSIFCNYNSAFIFVKIRFVVCFPMDEYNGVRILFYCPGIS